MRMRARGVVVLGALPMLFAGCGGAGATHSVGPRGFWLAGVEHETAARYEAAQPPGAASCDYWGGKLDYLRAHDPQAWRGTELPSLMLYVESMTAHACALARASEGSAAQGAASSPAEDTETKPTQPSVVPDSTRDRPDALARRFAQIAHAYAGCDREEAMKNQGTRVRNGNPEGCVRTLARQLDDAGWTYASAGIDRCAKASVETAKEDCEQFLGYARWRGRICERSSPPPESRAFCDAIAEEIAKGLPSIWLGHSHEVQPSDAHVASWNDVVKNTRDRLAEPALPRLAQLQREITGRIVSETTKSWEVCKNMVDVVVACDSAGAVVRRAGRTRTTRYEISNRSKVPIACWDAEKGVGSNRMTMIAPGKGIASTYREELPGSSAATFGLEESLGVLCTVDVEGLAPVVGQAAVAALWLHRVQLGAFENGEGTDAELVLQGKYQPGQPLTSKSVELKPRRAR